MTYKAYAAKSRKTRKGSRTQVFVYNKKLAKRLRKERRTANIEK